MKVSVLEYISYALFPRRCALCGKVVAPDMPVCGSCESDLEYVKGDLCPHCGREKKYCSCSFHRRFFEAQTAPFYYSGAAKRSIHVQEKTGKTKKEGKKDVDIIKGVITSESRKITFRDDSYSIDSKSRFADIVPEIEFSSDALIKALTDAIKAEASKGSKSVDELKKEQDSAAEKRAEKIAEAEAEAKIQKELSEITEKIKAFCIANKGKTAKLKPLVAAAKEMGYDNPMKVTNIDDAKKILELTVA